MNATQLRVRWRDGDGPALANEVLARLQVGTSLTGLPLEQFGGRIDLRGITVPKPTASRPKSYSFKVSDGSQFTQSWVSLDGVLAFKEVVIDGLDLSGADVAHFRFTDAQISNCVFDNAGCQDWRLWGTEISDCSFVAADVSDLSIGAVYQGRPNRLTQVDFTRAKLDGSRTRYWGIAHVEDCDFSFAHLENVNFFQADLIRCKFAGSLRSVVFDGRVLRPEEKATPNPMEDIDMSGVTTFNDVDFRGINFDRVCLPDDPNLFIMRDSRWIDYVLTRLRARNDIVASLAATHPEQALKFDAGAHSFINLGTAATSDGLEANRLLRLLLEEFRQTEEAK